MKRTLGRGERKVPWKQCGRSFKEWGGPREVRESESWGWRSKIEFQQEERQGERESWTEKQVTHLEIREEPQGIEEIERISEGL